MPHDKNGRVLAAGDLVTIAARVDQVTTGEEYCNLTLKTVEPMFPGEHPTSLVLNAKQVELVEKAAAPEPAAEPAAAAAE